MLPQKDGQANADAEPNHDETVDIERVKFKRIKKRKQTEGKNKDGIIKPNAERGTIKEKRTDVKSAFRGT